LPFAIAAAEDAALQKLWTPEISQSFWSAFNKLCQLIQPVTMDSIGAGHENIETIKWFPPRKVKISLGTRTSRRYLVVLFALIAATVPLQLYSWLYTIESKRVDDLISKLQDTYATLGESYTKLNGETIGKPSDKWSADQIATAEQMPERAKVWNNDIDRLAYHVVILNKLAFQKPAVIGTIDPQSFAKMQWYEAFNAVNERNEKLKLSAASAETAAGLIAGVLLSFVLPILFGMTGAVTFVIRTMSDQIKASTFSTTSPIRHLMRVTLGALAGLVVGLFSNLSNQITLPPLALAFLGGYGVEALFSMFDSFIAKFKAP